MEKQPTQPARFVGRATNRHVPNRFERVRVVEDTEHLDLAPEEIDPRRVVPTQFLPDRSRTLIRENESPDIPFRFSINPYRGCEHGCAYCYARPGHETLGMNAGIDFETKIVVKYDAAGLLRKELSRTSWHGHQIAMSGVTDCYQPVERRLQLTRACLEIMREARQAVGIVTKNALILSMRYTGKTQPNHEAVEKMAGKLRAPWLPTALGVCLRLLPTAPDEVDVTI